MDIQTKLNLILEQQEQNFTIEQIAENLEMTTKAVRSFMGRQNYKCKNGIFIKKEDTVDEHCTNEQLCLTEGLGSVSNTISAKKIVQKKEAAIIEEQDPKHILSFVAKTTKKPGKLELTPEFLDMIYELRDWYLEVKELPQLKHKVTKKNKTVFKDDELIEEPFNKRIQTDKELWENLTRLSENSGIEINELITQAIKNLLKEYKHLI